DEGAEAPKTVPTLRIRLRAPPGVASTGASTAGWLLMGLLTTRTVVPSPRRLAPHAEVVDADLRAPPGGVAALLEPHQHAGTRTPGHRRTGVGVFDRVRQQFADDQDQIVSGLLRPLARRQPHPQPR